jgi:glycolate oxidase
MIRQPDPKPDVMARRDSIVAGLRALLPETGLIAEPLRLKPYETDGLSAYRQVPLAVALPETTEQVAAVLRYCHQNGVRVIPRGAGTSLSGGALPMADAVVVGMMRMNQILDIDYPDRCAVVQAGVTNIGITNAVSADGFFYAPDPSSQLACMIGGNVNMNSGGAHCLKYGVTANNLLGLKIVTINGDVIDIGGAHLDAAGYDWLGLLTGSEGMLAMITEVTVRILRSPEGARAMLAAFKSNEVAGGCVDAIISSGIIPVALEFMDRPAIHACEASSPPSARNSTRSACGSRSPKPNPWRSGKAAKAHSARSAGSAPTTCAWMARFRPASCPWCSGVSRRCRTATA